jgi:3-mercaptopyruvate sulfurtransferase SseA
MQAGLTQVSVIQGGWQAWTSAGYPTEAGSAGAPDGTQVPSVAEPAATAPAATTTSP